MTHRACAHVVLSVQAEHTRHAAELDRLAEWASEHVIKPFCDARGWRFVAGMGTWVFFDAQDRQYSLFELEKMKGTKRLLAVLTADYNMTQDFGSMIPDYPVGPR